jgi:hypothetical protein
VKATKSVPEESRVIEDIVVRGEWRRIVFSFITAGDIDFRRR